MVLTQKDKEYLLDLRHEMRGLGQLKEAVNETVYTLNGNEITAEKTRELFGKENFLSGFSRSAFHWSTSREIDGSNKVVEFDSSSPFA